MKDQANGAEIGKVGRALMKLPLLLGLLILLSGCITINLNRPPQSADDQTNGTTQQNSSDDQEQDCDEQIRSAARMAAYLSSMTLSSTTLVQQGLSGDLQDNCLEDDTDLPRKHVKTNQPVGQTQPAHGAPIAALAPVGSVYGGRMLRTQSLSDVPSVTDGQKHGIAGI